MRVFIACLATETNTFAPFPTGMAQFEENGVTRDASISGIGPFAPPLTALRRRAEAGGHEVIESLSAFAQPSGRTTRAVYEQLRDAILADLQAAGPVDMALFMLHGAMVADGYDDCEGDFTARVRALAPRAVIGIELDPHCHLTDAMVAAADFVVIGREYPHIDFPECAEAMFDLAAATAEGRVRPVAALVDCRMIGFYPTFDPPMKQIVDAFRAAETHAPILSASLAHGFPWGDVSDIGTKVLVYADGDEAAARAEAQRLAGLIYDQRHALYPDYPGVAASLDRARGLNGRTVLGDFADNPGGGAPGDSTFFLSELVARDAADVAIGVFWDPFVASVCAEAGVGARLPVRLGGKCGPMSGPPVDLEVEVMGVVEQHSQGCFGARQTMGRSVWLRSRGLDIAVCSKRTQVFEPDAFTGLGISLDDKRLVVVKSSNHYRAGFDGMADHLWHVASPGAMSLDFRRIPYTRLANPGFPMQPDPWSSEGPPQPRAFRSNRQP